jgi:hypothetical protein
LKDEHTLKSDFNSSNNLPYCSTWLWWRYWRANRCQTFSSSSPLKKFSIFRNNLQARVDIQECKWTQTSTYVSISTTLLSTSAGSTTLKSFVCLQMSCTICAARSARCSHALLFDLILWNCPSEGIAEDSRRSKAHLAHL